MTVSFADNNAKVSRYFNVLEVTKGDKRRIPATVKVINNILALAIELDKIREEWGAPIIVTSWYRPKAINAAVGGVANSSHIQGYAVDIRPVYASDFQPFEKFLLQHWYGHLGLGQAKQRGFTHIDMRNGKGWRSGGTKGNRFPY